MERDVADNGNGPAPQEASHAGIEPLARGAHQAVDRAAGAAGEVADTLAANGRQIKDLPAQIGQTCRAQVREHPLATLGVAVAAGFALSWLMRAR
jgi:ElaB/YqjD/DUF883 family membrane-anchored ribosome-binding protein